MSDKILDLCRYVVKNGSYRLCEVCKQYDIECVECPFSARNNKGHMCMHDQDSRYKEIAQEYIGKVYRRGILR